MKTAETTTEANKRKLHNSYNELGKPKTYFFKKTSATVSKEICVAEAASMLKSLSDLKKTGDDILKDVDGKIVIEKIHK